MEGDAVELRAAKLCQGHRARKKLLAGKQEAWLVHGNHHDTLRLSLGVKTLWMFASSGELCPVEVTMILASPKF